MFNKKKIEVLELSNARLNNQVKKAFSQIGRNAEIHNTNVDFANDHLKKVKSELTQIKSEIANLKTENESLRTELTTLKAGKQPKAAYNMPEIVSGTDYYRVTFRDENGGIKTQVEVTPDRVIATANKITLNGVDVSNTQI